MPTNTSNASSGASAAPASDVLPVDELTDRPGATAVDLQFPSMAGKPNVEVAKRSTDSDKASSTTYEKVFVLLKREWDICDKDKVHEASTIAVRQFLTDNGLRTDQDVSFVGEEDVPSDIAGLPERKRSVGLRYRVTAVPAAIVAAGGLVSEANTPETYDPSIVKV